MQPPHWDDTEVELKGDGISDDTRALQVLINKGLVILKGVEGLTIEEGERMGGTVWVEYFPDLPAEARLHLLKAKMSLLEAEEELYLAAKICLNHGEDLEDEYVTIRDKMVNLACITSDVSIMLEGEE